MLAKLRKSLLIQRNLGKIYNYNKKINQILRPNINQIKRNVNLAIDSQTSLYPLFTKLRLNEWNSITITASYRPIYTNVKFIIKLHNKPNIYNITLHDIEPEDLQQLMINIIQDEINSINYISCYKMEDLKENIVGKLDNLGLNTSNIIIDLKREKKENIINTEIEYQNSNDVIFRYRTRMFILCENSSPCCLFFDK